MNTTISKYLFLLVFALITSAATAQSTEASKAKGNSETIELKVKGVCGMCKSRIELAVYDMKGVKSAEWDIESEVLTVNAKKGKVTREDVAETLARAGHSNELKKADAEAYKELPGCCKYDDGVKKHGIERK